MAKLPLTLPSLEELDEEAKALTVADLYEPDPSGQGVRLAVDGLPDLDGINTALAKERKRAKELADALKKFEGVDVEEYRGLTDKRDEIEQQHQLAHGNYNDAVAKATEKMQADFTKQVRSLTDRLGTIEQERNQALADLKRYNIERELERAAVKLRVRPEYYDDLRLRVDKFDIADGHVVVIGPDGEPRRSGKDARHYMLPDEWLESMQGEKPGWFEPSAGAGAVGGTRAALGRGPVIDRDDLDAFAANLEKIATGKLTVQ